MHFLQQLGLGDICEDEDLFLHLMQYTCENGEVFRGYYGFYIWYRWFGILEFNCHVEPDDDGRRLTGFTTHISSNCIWKLAVADTQQELLYDEEDREEKYVLEREYDFTDPQSDEPDGSVHISLVNADVIPDYHSGDLITMQVSAIASKVSYYPDESAFENHPITKIMGSPVLYPMNHVSNFLGNSIVTGEIKSVKNFTFINRAEQKIPIYYIEVETQYGPLVIVHPASLVEDGQQENIRPGAVVSAVCDIQGDVAIDEYQQGAVFDEEHFIALFHSCFVERDFMRLTYHLAEKCRYVSRDEEVLAEGRNGVLAFLTDTMSHEQKEHIPCYSWIGKVTGYKLEEGNESTEDLPSIGTHCVILVQNEERQVDCILFLILDEEGKIEEIRSASKKYGPCQISLIGPMPKDNEDGACEDYERINKPRTESEYLDMLASAYEKGNFQEMSLYFGFAAECHLELNPADDAITHRIKDRESMYNHLTENLKALPDLAVQVVDGALWEHKAALDIKSSKANLIVYIDLNHEGYIQTMHEIWQYQ